MVPAGEGWPSKVHEIDFYSFPDDIFCKSLEKRFHRLQVIEGSENEIHTENTDGFLLESIRRISQVYMQQNIIGWTAWLQLKPETDPAVGVVRSGIVARLDGVGKGKKRVCGP